MVVKRWPEPEKDGERPSNLIKEVSGETGGLDKSETRYTQLTPL